MPPPHPQHANLGVRGSSLLSILCDILYIDQYLRVAMPDCQIRFGNFLARVVGGVPSQNCVCLKLYTLYLVDKRQLDKSLWQDYHQIFN